MNLPRIRPFHPNIHRTIMTRSLSDLSYKLSRPGQVNAPGSFHDSKETTEQLLLIDAEKHHCYFRSSGFHNHLSHHLLAAYDLGASSAHLKKINEDEARTQRPIIVEDKDASIVVTDDNWVQYLGSQGAYGAFVTFFSGKVKHMGVTATLQQYVFDKTANTDGNLMLVRLVSGAVHPFIQLGYGAEFGNDTIIATALAQTAIHTPTAPQIYNFDFTGEAPGSSGLPVLEILRKVYDSTALHPPMPYEPDAFHNARIRQIVESDRPKEISSICSEFHIDLSLSGASFNDHLSSKVEELIWASTLLMSATGHVGRKPRLDFFLMHLVTSSLFLKPLLQALNRPLDKANLLRAFLPTLILICLTRGRPRINPSLLMTYTNTPRPPTSSPFRLSKSALGSPLNALEYNPWPAMLSDVIYHPDAHVVKTFRSLTSASREYGTTPPGCAIGAFRGSFAQCGKGSDDVVSQEAATSSEKQETHEGTSIMDGTIFVRAAGMLMDYMGWVVHGQEARGNWDQSALGWDAAWENEDD